MRRGLGKGLGMGYKNLVPKDPYIHGLSARGIKTEYQVTTVALNRKTKEPIGKARTLFARTVKQFIQERKEFMFKLKTALKKEGLNAKVRTLTIKPYGAKFYEQNIDKDENEVSIVMEKFVDKFGYPEHIMVGILGYPVNDTTYKKIKGVLDKGLVHYTGGESKASVFLFTDNEVLLQ
jgi:hypothetical protein